MDEIKVENVRKNIGFAGQKNTPLGEGHPRAKLTDAQVDQMRDWNEDGDDSGVRWGYRKLAKHFGVHRQTVADICKYRRRCSTPEGYRTLLVPSGTAIGAALYTTQEKPPSDVPRGNRKARRGKAKRGR